MEAALPQSCLLLIAPKGLMPWCLFHDAVLIWGHNYNHIHRGETSCCYQSFTQPTLQRLCRCLINWLASTGMGVNLSISNSCILCNFIFSDLVSLEEFQIIRFTFVTVRFTQLCSINFQFSSLFSVQPTQLIWQVWPMLLLMQYIPITSLVSQRGGHSKSASERPSLEAHSPS